MSPSSLVKPFLSMASQIADDTGDTDEVLVHADYNPRLPNGIVVAVLLAVGLVGNSLVLYVYHFKMQRTVFTTFVTVLAALDLTTALVGMPIDVVIKTAMLGESRAFNAICKAAHFEVYSTSLASGSVLLLITITRHTKVCRPLEPGLTKRKARLLCAMIVVGAMVLCTVTLVINGVEMVKLAVGERDYLPRNVTNSSSTGFANEGAGMTAKALTSALRDLTAEETGNANGALRSNTSVHRKRTEVVQIYICRTSEEHKGTALYYALQALLMTAFTGIFVALLILHCRISNSLAQFERRRSSMRRASIHADVTHITASMFRIFATITVIFVVSYLPHLICLLVEKFLFTPGEAMPQATRIIMDLAYNFPYINVVANPFIYGYRSVAFRQHCLRLVCRCCCCGRKYYR